ncbi:MAG: DUF538 domain-containing protein, partial [Deltaproteobacteria bacterium]|nr:DUF538 domain-containing protein [Deltaproteobacteria bacterium]
MVLGKEPPEAVKDEATRKKALTRDPPQPKKAKKAELKTMKGGFRAQSRAVAAREQVPSNKGAAAAKKAPQPLSDIKKAFRDMDLPERLAPANVETASYDRKTGNLSITLKNGFSKRFDEENTITFEKRISGHLSKGALTGISGIRRGSASIE